MKRSHILMDPGADAAAGGAATATAGQASALGAAAAAVTNWRDSLPEDLRAAPSLASFKDVGSLAKSYVEAQKLIGTDKIPAPNDKWTDQEWAGLYDRLGRPKEAKNYGPAQGVTFAEGTIDPKALDQFKQLFHESGLSTKQGEKILTAYANMLNDGKKQMDDQRLGAKNAAVADIEKEFGSRANDVIQRAAAAVQKFGGQDLFNYLDQSGLGNNPVLIRAFAKIGESISEDSANTSGTSATTYMDATAAKAEIAKLNSDPEFQKLLRDRWAPGYQAATARMLELHKRAYPAREEE